MDSTKIKPIIEKSWEKVLKTEFNSEYFKKLKAFLVEEKKAHRVFPAGSHIFNAFNLTPFNEVKVVIIGQDPYHGVGQAHGLSFSVPTGVKPPPSLVNIFKEINNDLDLPVPNTGNLEPWAKQGVLLLNATLTVRAHQAGSHQNRGWEQFTDAIITNISNEKEGIVFLLWGSFAKQKRALIDSSKHHVLMATHPSPFAAHKGFFGCKHFSKANELLVEHNKTPIDWSL